MPQLSERLDGVVHMEGCAATGEDSLGANELVFGAEANLCDITPLINDAIMAALPTVCLCGGSSCLHHAGREVVWSTAPQVPPAAASPFAKLRSGGGSSGGKQRGKTQRRGKQ